MEDVSISAIAVLGFAMTLIYLSIRATDENKKLKQENKNLRTRIDMLEGDRQMLSDMLTKCEHDKVELAINKERHG